MRKLLVITALEDRLKKKIQEQVPPGWEVRFFVGEDEDGVRRNLSDAEVIFTWPWFFRESYLDDVPHLKWVQTLTAGADEYPLRKMEERGLLLSGVHGDTHSIPISEHVLGVMLVFARHLHTFHKQKQERSWKQLEMGEFDELHGKHAGVLGLGNIGREVARKCKAMGMKTFGMGKIPQDLPYVDAFYLPSELQEILSNSDFVIVALPLTQRTRGLIAKKELRVMKKRAYLINVSRGGIVNEQDLVTALQERWIAGAGLDVFQEEPLPQDSPFYEMDNVVFTPHVASRSPLHFERAIGFSLDNLERYLSGKTLRGLVDYALEY